VKISNLNFSGSTAFSYPKKPRFFSRKFLDSLSAKLALKILKILKIDV
jgi:hypothetical protein